ncbi:Fibrinogen-like protein A [Holothuria leucospilota]|uniref:Fibrinogen-like protein A n=1 Tax=Holothuria leucospilota TaxID=206669 RepID=A0A9Q1B9B4_HOLLE|nr:Fibrinogen-like protein A [Holothuria leucospilota]
MASSTKLYMVSFALGVCSFFLDGLSAEGGSEFFKSWDRNNDRSTFFFYQKLQYPGDCTEVRDSCSSSVSSGTYLIKPDGYEEPFEAFCDNEIDSGGWTVILRRLDGSVSFKRNWINYKKGFGFLSTELWLGNEKVSYLTNQAKYELRIDMTLDNGTSCNVNNSSLQLEEGDQSLPTDVTDVSTSFTDCNNVYNAGNTHDGVYSIRPRGWTGSPFDVFCYMSFDGGSWVGIAFIIL